MSFWTITFPVLFHKQRTGKKIANIKKKRPLKKRIKDFICFSLFPVLRRKLHHGFQSQHGADIESLCSVSVMCQEMHSKVAAFKTSVNRHVRFYSQIRVSARVACPFFSEPVTFEIGPSLPVTSNYAVIGFSRLIVVFLLNISFVTNARGDIYLIRFFIS